MGQAARRAGQIVPAVGVAAALAVAVHSDALGRMAPAVAERMDPAHLSRSGRAAGAAAGRPWPAASGVHRPKRVIATGAGRSAKRSHGGPASVAGDSGRTASRRRHAVSPAAHRTMTCSGTGELLPANYATIVRFLTSNGYTGIAAAGIAGNVYQESKGDPESVGSGGGGLIGWTPLPAGYVTGNPAADLQTQLQAILVYNQQWSAYLPALNAATSATAAADIYMNDFERPGIPAASNREAAANAVATACGL